MSRRGDRDLGKERFWRRMLRPLAKVWPHGADDFCAEHGVSEPAFYAWRRTIVARDQQAAESPRPEGKRLPLFVPVRVSLASVAALEIVLRDDRVVRVPAGFDAPLGRRKELPRGGYRF